MNTLDIENLFATVLGIPWNTRGDVNDADIINMGDVSDLVSAVRKAIGVLNQRSQGLPRDGSNLTINAIGRFNMTMDSIERSKDDVVGSTKFHYWSIFAISLNLIHWDLKSFGR